MGKILKSEIRSAAGRWWWWWWYSDQVDVVDVCYLVNLLIALTAHKCAAIRPVRCERRSSCNRFSIWIIPTGLCVSVCVRCSLNNTLRYIMYSSHHSSWTQHLKRRKKLIVFYQLSHHYLLTPCCSHVVLISPLPLTIILWTWQLISHIFHDAIVKVYRHRERTTKVTTITSQ